MKWAAQKSCSNLKKGKGSEVGATETLGELQDWKGYTADFTEESHSVQADLGAVEVTSGPAAQNMLILPGWLILL